MKKDVESLSIFEIEELIILINDFKQLLKDQDAKIDEVFSKKDLDTSKCEEIRSIVAALMGYENSLNTINLRIKNFKKENKSNSLSCDHLAKLNLLKRKVDKCLIANKEVVTKCADFLGFSIINKEI